MRKRQRPIDSRILGAGLVAALLIAACKRGTPEARSTDSASVMNAARVGAFASDAASGMAVAASAAIRPDMASGTRAEAPRSGMDRAVSATGSAAGVNPGGAMLVRQGQASLEVRRLGDAVSKLRAVAGQLGGFVANTSIRSGRDEAHAATIEVRVPTDRFDALVGALDGLGTVESVTAAAQDVGDEYVDLAARAANARRVEARLTEMLATRTGKLSEVLTMEQELARVQEEIERYQARLKYLERLTTFSTLSITIHEPLPLIERQPGAGPITAAFVAAWERAVGVLAWCIASLGILVPGAILVGGVVVGGRWLARRGASGGAGRWDAHRAGEPRGGLHP
jgi:hypothetical protein